MKRLARTLTAGLLAVSLATAPIARAADAVAVSLADVVERVSTENYLVQENALRVYQAKKQISVARGNLLPKLNFWRIISLAFDPTAWLGLVGDIAPFLVPANWFKLKQEKVLHLAQREAYRALWANEVLNAKSLYLEVLLDEALLGQIRRSTEAFGRIQGFVADQEQLGAVAAGSARDLEIRVLALLEDQRALEKLILEERLALTQALGVSHPTPVALRPVTLRRFDQDEPLEYADFEFRALDTSPEVRQYDYFIKAADYVKKEVLFSFMGVSSVSRSAAGGIFDSVPISDGFGFGTGASVKIAKAEKEALAVQRRGVIETLKRQLQSAIDTYNLDVRFAPSARKRVTLAERAERELYEQLRFGSPVDAVQLLESSRSSIQSTVALLTLEYRFRMNEDRVLRILFHEDYAKVPAAIESLKEGARP